MNFISRIIGTVFFNKKAIKDVARSSNATTQAIAIIFIGSLISALFQALAYQKTGNASSLGVYGSILESVLTSGSTSSGKFVAVLVLVFLFQLLSILFLSAVLAFVGRLFGGKFSTMEVLRLIGFVSVLSILSSLLLYADAMYTIPAVGLIATIISLWKLCLYVYGYAVEGGIGIIKAIIAIILAFILAIILIIVIVLLFFVSLLTILSNLVILV